MFLEWVKSHIEAKRGAGSRVPPHSLRGEQIKAWRKEAKLGETPGEGK